MFGQLVDLFKGNPKVRLNPLVDEGKILLAMQLIHSKDPLLRHFLKLSPSESHMFKTVSQELCPSDATSQRTAAVPDGARRCQAFSLLGVRVMVVG